MEANSASRMRFGKTVWPLNNVVWQFAPTRVKITVDGGIHWATTRLTEPYGPKRIAFYRLTDPEYRGEQYYSVAEMQAIFATAEKLGWQMSCHVTGDCDAMACLAELR